MRYIELFEGLTSYLTYDDVLAIYPQIESDLISVGEWQHTLPTELKYKLVIESIDLVIQDAKEMYASYDEFPKDAKRTDKIIKLLRSGATQLPVFIESGDSNNFVMEGRHRMVAFYILEMKTLPVIYISK